MLQHLNKQLGIGVTALAVALIAVIVVQTPVAIVDQTLHASGQAHAANAFAGPLAVELVDHDHEHQAAEYHHDDDVTVTAPLVVDDDRDPSPSQGAHHHHDGTSFVSLGTVWAAVSPWIAADTAWPGQDTSLPSAEPCPNKRPPKASLEHVV